MEKLVTAKGKKRNVVKANRSHLPTFIRAKSRVYQLRNSKQITLHEHSAVCFSALLANRHKKNYFYACFHTN